MKKVVIGVSCGEKDDIQFPAQYVNDDYVDAIVKAGGIPVLLPICDKSAIDGQLDILDGVIMSGGVDMNPLFYNDTYHEKQGISSYRRDVYDLALLKKCIERKMPVLGICRGMQGMNVAFGGTLYQDNQEAGSVNEHTQKERKQYPIHSINIGKGSFLYSVLGNKYLVNSFHHQSVKDLGEGLVITAKASDGIVEGIEHKELKCFGVQFHPEMMHNDDEGMQNIFNHFINICKG